VTKSAAQANRGRLRSSRGNTTRSGQSAVPRAISKTGAESAKECLVLSKAAPRQRLRASGQSALSDLARNRVSDTRPLGMATTNLEGSLPKSGCATAQTSAGAALRKSNKRQDPCEVIECESHPISAVSQHERPSERNLERGTGRESGHRPSDPSWSCVGEKRDRFSSPPATMNHPAGGRWGPAIGGHRAGTRCVAARPHRHGRVLDTQPGDTKREARHLAQERPAGADRWQCTGSRPSGGSAPSLRPRRRNGAAPCRPRGRHCSHGRACCPAAPAPRPWDTCAHREQALATARRRDGGRQAGHCHLDLNRT